MKKYFIHLVAIVAVVAGVSYYALYSESVLSADYVYVNSSDASPDTESCGDSSNPCNSIQAAINTAHPGQTVKIAEGVYTENLNLNKSLSLVGEGNLKGDEKSLSSDKGVVLMPADASQPAIVVSTIFDGIHLKDIHVKGSTGGVVMQMAFTGKAHDLSLENVVFDGAARSIGNSSSYLPNVDDVKIVDSAFRCSAVTASGLEVWFAQSNLEISGNYITNCRDGINVSNGGGLTGPLAGNNVIARNTVDNVGDSAIQIAIGSENLSVRDNVIIRAGALESEAGEGIQIQTKGSATTVSVSGNKIESSDRAIVLDSLPNTGSNILIEKNVIRVNNAGVAVLSSVSLANVTGIHINSNIFGGNQVGVQNDTTVTLDAGRNFWGDETGPKVGANPSGKGDSIVGLVAFDPWYIKENLNKLSNEIKVNDTKSNKK